MARNIRKHIQIPHPVNERAMFSFGRCSFKVYDRVIEKCAKQFFAGKPQHASILEMLKSESHGRRGI